MFFHPEFFHKDWTTPLDEIVDEVVQSCPLDFRTMLYKNVVLSGGSTLFDGFDTRLMKGVQNRVDSRLKAYADLSGKAPQPIPVVVQQNLV